MKNYTIKMCDRPLAVGQEFMGDKLLPGNFIRGQPFRIIETATRAQFVAQFEAGEMTEETRHYLEAHPGLYFYRTGPPESLEGLIMWLALDK